MFAQTSWEICSNWQRQILLVGHRGRERDRDEGGSESERGIARHTEWVRGGDREEKKDRYLDRYSRSAGIEKQIKIFSLEKIRYWLVDLLTGGSSDIKMYAAVYFHHQYLVNILQTETTIP